jgi:hypothetical protein
MSNAGASWGSPTQQGPDWWQASDGLWYPPAEQAAAPPTTAPVAPAAPPVAAPQYAPPQYSQPAVPQYAAAPASTSSVVRVSYDGPVEEVARLRPFYSFFLVIPQIFGFIGATILGMFSTYAAIFGVILKGRVHPRSHDTIVRMYRYQWRLQTFIMCWRNEPPVAPAAGAMDPGDDPARLSIAYGGEGLNRIGPIIKPFLAIPQIIVLFFALIGAYIAWIIGIFGVLFKGTFPQAQRDTIVRVTQKAMEINAYILLTDVKPGN